MGESREGKGRGGAPRFRADRPMPATTSTGNGHTKPPPKDEYPAYLVRVIDGDTVVVQIDLGFGVFITRHIRLIATDCPEMNAHIEGNLARDACVTWWAHNRNQATLKTNQQTDHYGRILGDFLDAHRCTLSAYLQAHHCRPR